MRKYLLAATFAIATLTGCASDRDNRILTGAAVGGVLGNVLGNGSTGATVGGAVVGGAIGAHTARDRDYRYNRSTNARDADYRYRFNSCMRSYSRSFCERNVRY